MRSEGRRIWSIKIGCATPSINTSSFTLLMILAMYFFRTFNPDQSGPDRENDVFCQVGAVLVKLCTPSWIYTLEPTWIRPTRTHAFMGSVVTLVFRIRQILSDRRWGPHPSYDLSLVAGRSC